MTTAVETDVDAIEELDFDVVCSIRVLPHNGSWIPCEQQAQYLAIVRCCGDGRLVCDFHLRQRNMRFNCPGCDTQWDGGFPPAVAHFYPL